MFHICFTAKGWPSCCFSQGLLCLVVDLLVGPLEVFSERWPYIPHDIKAALSLIPAFWAMDILVTFCTPYYWKGDLVCRHVQIARKYAREWLFFDVLYVAVDCVVLLGDQISASSMVAFRLTQLLLRLVRLTRCQANFLAKLFRFRQQQCSTLVWSCWQPEVLPSYEARRVPLINSPCQHYGDPNAGFVWSRVRGLRFSL